LWGARNGVLILLGVGRWQTEVRLDKAPALDDLVWHRVRYRFEYGDRSEMGLEGTESISQILRMPVVHILGQQSYLTVSRAAVRVVVRDSKNEAIAGPSSTRIELLIHDEKARLLFTGRLDARGTTEAQFQFPAGLEGNYQLHYVADTPIGSTEFTQAVRLEDKVSILLTTEKPIYQPGQTIHIRALALDGSNHEAAANRKLSFEVEDSHGNKVFKKSTESDKFGIASADFSLADEVNLGTYHLRALMGESEAAPTNTAEIALSVEQYLLPKFKVAVEFTGNHNRTKRGYRPGDHVTGTVRANYFFGKPVEAGQTNVKASSMDVSVFEVGSVQGKTGRDGTYRFDLRLPGHFAGRPLSHGAARVLIEATVKDSANHAETRGEPITVSEFPLLITAIPEGGTLVPNLENQVFILTSYPDGTPASADITVHTGEAIDQHVATDNAGAAVIHFTPGAGTRELTLEARDKENNRASSTVELQAREGQDQILLRTERAVYRAGERIELRIFSTRKRGDAYVDIVKEGQTVMTRDVDIENGQAELSLIATPEMAGTVDFNAYLFGRDARPVGDHRLVFVQPADELKIEATADAHVYKPGDDARIQFRVTNSRGQGVSAALGLQIVDEAVFALAEKQPGFAKVFFYLEQEVLTPRYEIHSIGMPDIVEPVEESLVRRQDLAAHALFSATEMGSANKFETEFGRSVPQTKYADYSRRYQAHITAQVRRLSGSLGRAYVEGPDAGALDRIVAKMAGDARPELRDPWATNLRIESAGWDHGITHYVVRSAGPDKQFDTSDDVAAYLEVHRRTISGRPRSRPNSIDVNIEHDRGPFNGRAEIVGTALNQSGDRLEGATFQVHELSTGKTRTAMLGADGRFGLGALPAGDYQVQVSAGSDTVFGNLELRPRDRAILSVFLRHESAETVVAVSEATGIMAEFRVRAFDLASLPLNGRNFAELARLGPVPGIARAATLDGLVAVVPSPAARPDDAVSSASLAKEAPASSAARAVVLPRGTLYQPGNHYGPGRPRQHYRPSRGLDHYVAHGDRGFHAAWLARQRHL
jgi:MG2 domain/Alpha-2-macroglobulin bait region domain